MKKLVAIAMIGILLASAPVFAGPLSKARVSAGANWVAHADYERFNRTVIGQLVRAEMANQGVEEKLQAFKAIFSFHPIDDVRNVTIYGNGEDRLKAVAMIQGSFNKDTLVSLVRMNAQYEETQHGGVTVHSWVDENKKDPNKPGERMYGCVAADDLVVLGAGLDAVKNAIDVLKGTATNAGGGVFKQSSLVAQGAFFQVAANAVGEMAEHQEDAALLQQTDEFGAVIGETDGRFYVDMSLSARSQEVAQNVKKMLEGIIAFFTLAGDKQPVLAELAKKLQLSTAENVVAVHFESESAAILSFLKEQWKAKQQQQVQ